MQRLEVSGAVRPIYGSLGVKRLKRVKVVLQEVGRTELAQDGGLVVSSV